MPACKLAKQLPVIFSASGGSASNYDVISPSSDVAASIARTGLAAPLPSVGLIVIWYHLRARNLGDRPQETMEQLGETS